MTWFKVDDGLHKHRKRVRVGLSVEGFAAMGLWTVAGSWSSDELTDGWIPDDVIDYLAPGIGLDLARRLEKAGLWHRVTRDGEEGWQFHDWTDDQPTRDQVLAERAAAALRQKRARDRAKEKRDKEGQEGAASRRDSRVTNAGTHAEVTPAVTVPPTRPDPTYIEPPTEVLAATVVAATPDQLFPVSVTPSAGNPNIPPTVAGEITARSVVAAFFDASRAAGFDDPTSGIVGKISRDAKRLLTKEGIDPQKLLNAATVMGENGWTSLDHQLHRMEAERVQTERMQQGRRSGQLSNRTPQQRTGAPSTGTQRFQQAMNVAEELDRQYANGGKP